MDNSSKSVVIWESKDPVSFAIQESASEVDGQHILAKIVGPAFFPDSVSRNKVHYPMEAWENAISNDNFQVRLQDRLVFGTIGHDPELGDNEIREGKMSHIMTKVWIDENDGIGKAEYLVLNTPPGRVLNTLVRAGSKLRVSTRAEGFFENSPNRDGSKSVIPEKFILERIDFVSDPGYKQALPSLIESNNSSNFLNEDVQMSEQATAQQILESRIKEIKEENDQLKTELKSTEQELSEIEKEKLKSETTLESYRNFGTVAAIQESLSELDQYRTIGTVQELHEVLETGEETVDALTDTLDDTKAELEKLSAEVQNKDYSDLGEPSEVRDALDAAQQIIAELEQYRELGTIEELKAVIDRANEMTEALEEQELQALADKFQVNIETVRSLCGKCETLAEAEQLLVDIKGVPASECNVPRNSPDLVTENDEEWFNEDGTPNPDGCYDIDGIHHPEREKSGNEPSATPVTESMSSRLLNRSHKFASRIKESNNTSKKQTPTSLAARLMAPKR